MGRHRFLGKWTYLASNIHEASKRKTRRRYGPSSSPTLWRTFKKEVFNKIKSNIEANKINYIDKPYTRFEGTKFEQNTFFIEDPNGNVLELKTFD